MRRSLSIAAGRTVTPRVPRLFSAALAARPCSPAPDMRLSIPCLMVLAGVANVKGWVEAHGERIWAGSEGLGKGTTVTVPMS